VGESRYEFAPASGTSVEVTVEFAPFGSQGAAWDGAEASFLATIAGARTFGYRHQAADLRALGRAQCVNPRAVVVLESDGSVMPPGEPPKASELARHKLLDLLGDLYLYGGPPQGRIRVERPGHQSNHRAVCEGFARGLLERRPPEAVVMARKAASRRLGVSDRHWQTESRELMEFRRPCPGEDGEIPPFSAHLTGSHPCCFWHRFEGIDRLAWRWHVRHMASHSGNVLGAAGLRGAQGPPGRRPREYVATDYEDVLRAWTRSKQLSS